MRILYYLLLVFLYAIALLPFWVLYLLSNCIYFFLFHVFGYRKKVVFQNLKNSFPEKSKAEINLIAKKYYLHLSDLIVETIKALTITQKQLHERFTFEGAPVFEKYYKENRSIIAVMGHYGNWELGGARFASENLHPMSVLYRPPRSFYANKLIVRLRSGHKYGLIPMKNVLRAMLSNKDKMTATVFIGDQSPPRKGAYWMEFLNQDTAVFMGTEKIAKKLNYVVVYFTIKKVKRGFYSMHSEVLFDQPKDTTEFEITKAHTRKLEKNIREQPEIWLWSHRRWKHKREENIS